METLRLKLKNILEKIKMAEEIYSCASLKIEKEEVATYLESLAKEKKERIWRLTQYPISGSQSPNVQPEAPPGWRSGKIRSEIESIVFSLKRSEMLAFCTRREEELISMYHNVLINYRTDGNFRNQLVSQLKASRSIIQALRMINT